MPKLICPECKKQLPIGVSAMMDNLPLHCNSCNADYPVINGIPCLLPKNISGFKEQEISFHNEEFKKSRHSYEYVTENFTEDSWGLMRFMEFFKDIPKEAKILELGSGNAQYGITLKRKGYKNVYCSDITLTGLLDAAQYAKNNNLACENFLYVFDAEHIPFADESFDCVYLVASLHHFENPRAVIKEIERCLTPGGRAIIAIEPNKWYFYIMRPLAGLFRMRLIQKEGVTSIADEKTKGFTLKELIKIAAGNGLVLTGVQRLWYKTGFLYYFEEISPRIFKKKIKIPLFLKKFAKSIDRMIEKIPGVNNLSFHNTICVRKNG